MDKPRRANHGLRKVCGHPRHQQSKCPDPYHFNYRGVRVSVDVQAGEHIATRGEAEALAAVWRKQIDDKVFVRRTRMVLAPAAATVNAFTLDTFAALYLRECSLPTRAGKPLRDRHHPDYYVFRPLLAFELPDGRRLGALPFASLTEAHYEKYIAARREEDYAASTVNKDVQLITAMCRWAARRGLFGPFGLNPISGESRVLVRKAHVQRHRRVTDADLAALQKHTDAHLWAFIELALITCLRLTELYRVRWADFRGLHLQVRAEATKVATAARKAPLNDRGVAILTYLRVDPGGRQYPDGDFIFGQCGEQPVDINDRFNTAVLKAFALPTDDRWANGSLGPTARAQLDAIDLLFGDLRHEGALRKYEQGWALNELQVLLGHTNLVQTSTYLGVGNDEVLKAMARCGSGAKVLDEIAACNLDLQTVAIRPGKRGKKKGGKQQVSH